MRNARISDYSISPQHAVHDFPGSMHRIVGGDYWIIPYLGPSVGPATRGLPWYTYRGVHRDYCLPGMARTPPGTPGTPPGTQNLVHDFPGSMHKKLPGFPIKNASPVFATFQVFSEEDISGHHWLGPVRPRKRGPNAPRIPALRPWTISEEVRRLLFWRERCAPDALVPRLALSFHFCCDSFQGRQGTNPPQKGRIQNKTQHVVCRNACILHLHAGCISVLLDLPKQGSWGISRTPH